MNKILLIFGSQGALGKGITKVLSAKDYNKIYLFDRKEKEEPGANYQRIIINDLTDENNVKEAFDKIAQEPESCYFLVSTIGGFSGGQKIRETDYSQWQGMLDKNLNTSFLISKYFAKLASVSKGGSICYTSASVGLSAAANKAAYGTSKSALNYLVKTLALEGKGDNFTVNAIAPFIIDTPENRKWVKDTEILVNPESIGELVNSIFDSYKILSGNILELPGTLNYS